MKVIYQLDEMDKQIMKLCDQRKHPHGVDIWTMIRKLKSDVRTIKPRIEALKDNGFIGTGLYKVEGKPCVLERRYIGWCDKLEGEK
jgi:hypothetical protein